MKRARRARRRPHLRQPARTGHLLEIAALLDPRQFDLISRPDSGIVVIQEGGAGSGKTHHRHPPHGEVPQLQRAPPLHRRQDAHRGRQPRPSAPTSARSSLYPGLRGVVVGDLATGKWVNAARQRAFAWPSIGSSRRTPQRRHPLQDAAPGDAAPPRRRAAAYGADPRSRKDTRTASSSSGPTSSPNFDGALAAFAKDPDPRVRPSTRSKRACRWWRRAVPFGPSISTPWATAPSARPPRSPTTTTRTAWAPTPRPPAISTTAPRFDPRGRRLLVRAYQLVRGELKRGKQPPASLRASTLHDEAQDLAPIDLACPPRHCRAPQDGPRARAPPVRRSPATRSAQRLFMDSGFRRLAHRPRRTSDSPAPSTSSRSASPTAPPARWRLAGGPARRPRPPPIAPPHAARRWSHHHFPSQGAAVAFLADAIRPLMTSGEPRANLAILRPARRSRRTCTA